MATTEKKNTKGYETFRQDMKAGEARNVYLFYGEETYLCRRSLEEVRRLLIPAEFEEFNAHRVSGKKITVLELQEIVESMPMMAQHTLVEVTDMDLFRLDEPGRSQFIELLSDFPEYCTLIFIYDTVEYKRDKKMKKLCAALDEHVCEVEFCQQEGQILRRWIRKHFADGGHTIDDATLDHLLFTCGNMMTNLAPEIGKIVSYARNEAVCVADINAVVEPILDAKVFDMTNAVTAGKYDDAAGILGDLLRLQTEPIMILGAMGKELRRLYTARVALDEGKDRLWLKELWHMNSDYPAKLLLQAARKVDHHWCADALRRTQVLDRRMKSERGIDNEQELKAFLMELAGTR